MALQEDKELGLSLKVTLVLIRFSRVGSGRTKTARSLCDKVSLTLQKAP
jgi:hypothetical protein